MTNVISVKFRKNGKSYYFAPGNMDIKIGDNVIVETSRGLELGSASVGNHEIPDDKVVQPLKDVVRKATKEDLEEFEKNCEKENEAMRICKERIAAHELEMKLINCEMTFDKNKLLFYFTADGRVDFRELVKDLAYIFRTRIELRQVGVRDETRILGGLGVCGRPFCCSTYLNDFVPVSIKMAKEQKLSLNPLKISGACGRLMCCLKNEEDVYEELNKKLPAAGDRVRCSDGTKGEVVSVNVLRQRVKVVTELSSDEKEIKEYPANELEVVFKKKSAENNRADREGKSEPDFDESKADEEFDALLENDEENISLKAYDFQNDFGEKTEKGQYEESRNSTNDYSEFADGEISAGIKPEKKFKNEKTQKKKSYISKEEIKDKNEKGESKTQKKEKEYKDSQRRRSKRNKDEKYNSIKTNNRIKGNNQGNRPLRMPKQRKKMKQENAQD